MHVCAPHSIYLRRCARHERDRSRGAQQAKLEERDREVTDGDSESGQKRYLSRKRERWWGPQGGKLARLSSSPFLLGAWLAPTLSPLSISSKANGDLEGITIVLEQPYQQTDHRLREATQHTHML